MKVMLVLAAVVDLGLAALLIGVSGFIFGGGPEGMKGETGAVIVWVVALAATLAAPVAGFALLGRQRPGLGALVAWAPPIGGALFSSLPFNPY
ncbi:hypothetical protein [Reyranella sp.]|jgi:hypothetical protein|uniref:hypothetical protein n=1 Tax=Reyranella sp. TaxID=1929291 RepID=UPI002F94A8F5